MQALLLLLKIEIRSGTEIHLRVSELMKPVDPKGWHCSEAKPPSDGDPRWCSQLGAPAAGDGALLGAHMVGTGAGAPGRAVLLVLPGHW